jgi:SsrA-binding protein
VKKKIKSQKSILNKQSRFNYEQVDNLEVGMILTGPEVKAIRAGHMQLAGSYGRVLQVPKRPELWLVGAQVTGVNVEKQRSIKLLAHRSEIDKVMGLIGQKGYTLVPSKVYFHHGNAKLLLNVSKGLKTYEKRSKLRDRDVNRDIARSLRRKTAA